MHVLIVDNHSHNVPYIENALKKIGARTIIKKQDCLFSNIDKNQFGGVILSGGRPLLDKKFLFSQIRADISCLVNFNKPILGICEGHEIICYACGSQIVKLKNHARFRNLNVNILKKKKIFKGLPDNINAYEHHSRYARNVPDILEVAASSRKDTIEAVFHRERPIFGLQFHPERMGKTGIKIIKNFIDICSRK